jgi:hypothetical protein
MITIIVSLDQMRKNLKMVVEDILNRRLISMIVT